MKEIQIDFESFKYLLKGGINKAIDDSCDWRSLLLDLMQCLNEHYCCKLIVEPKEDKNNE